MWLPNAFYPSLVAMILDLAFIAYILKVGLRKPGNVPSFLLFLTIFIGVFGELLERIAGPPPQDYFIAYVGAKLIGIGSVLLSATLIHFALDFPYRLKIKRKTREIVLAVFYSVSVIGVILILLNDYLGKPMIVGLSPYPALGQQIWGMEYGAVYGLYMLWAFMASVAVLGLLFYKMKNTKINLIKKQIVLILSGMLIVEVMISVSVLLPALFDYEMYPLSSIAMTIFSMFVSYTIMKYRLFLVSPAAETTSGTRKYELQPGTVRVVSEEHGFELFTDQVYGGIPGLLFTTKDIEKIRERYNLVETPIFRVCKTPGRDTLNPMIGEHREMIAFIISEFLEEAQGVVYLNSIDSMFKKNDFESFLEIISEYIKEEKKGVLLISLSGNDGVKVAKDKRV